MDEDGGFVFNFSEDEFDEDNFFFFDPEIAIGYDYRVVNALFDEVEAPVLPFDSSYNLLGSSDNCATFDVPLLTGPLIGGVRVSLTSPQECFRIDGIDVANMLDPTDTTAFVTGVSLASITAGQPITITQTPITTFVPGTESVPGPLPVIGAGMALGWSRRLRRRVKQAKVKQAQRYRL